MKRVFFTKDYHHNLAERVGVTYRRGTELEVDDNLAERAVLKGCAVFSAFAEDDLMNRAEIEARGDAIRQDIQNFYDSIAEGEGEEA